MFWGLGMIPLCMVAGAWLRSSGRVAPGASRALNAFVLHVPLPALVLVKMHELLRAPPGGSGGPAWVPISMAWLQYGLAALFALALGKAMRLSRGTIGALTLTVGLGNTSFVGFPLLEALMGREAIPIGVLVDQPGTFLVFSTLGVLTAALAGGRDAGVSPATIARRTLTFPPLLALIAAVALSPLEFAPGLIAALEKIAASLVPVALVSVGLQLRLESGPLRRRLPELACALGFKLVAVPALFWAFYRLAGAEQGFMTRVTVVEAAMAPMITGAVLADEAGLDGELSGLMLGVGIPLSLVTVPIWAWLV